MQSDHHRSLLPQTPSMFYWDGGIKSTSEQGNTNFRKIVEEHALKYTGSQDRREKEQIAREVISVVHISGGRFLRGVSSESNTLFEVVEAETVVTKSGKPYVTVQ